jgi:hypothetical protein
VTKRFYAIFIIALSIPALGFAQDSKPASKPAVKPTPDKKPATTPDGKAYSLSYKFTKGESRTYQLRATQKMAESFEMKASQRLVETCKEVDAKKKSATLEVDGQTLKLAMTMGQNTQEFDSEKPDPNANEREKEAMKKMMGKNTVNIAFNGAIARSKKFIEGPNRDILRSFLCSIEQVPYDFLLLPEKAIKAGESWTNALDRNLKGPGNKGVIAFRTTFTYTLKRVKNRNGIDIATINVSSTTTILNKDNLPDVPAIKDAGGKGTIIFNVTSGHIKNLNFSTKLTAIENNRDEVLSYSFNARLKKAEKKD